ncbi:TPA: phage tail protein [Citrobacter freundii]
MATKYYAVLTNVGAAKLANATALGAQVEITQMAVGDGNGVLPTPNPAQTALVHELRRKPLNSLSIDPNNANQIIAEQVIPEDEGGWWIREIGLFDKDGDMIAVANCAETYKPQLQEGSGRVQVVRMILIVSSTAAVTLKIDPSVVLATRQYVDDQIIQVKSYVDQKMAAHVAAADPHKQYAPKESPALTGRPTAPTAEGKDSSTQIANTAFVQAAIAALVGSSPEALDTLNELAAALGNDPNFATTVTNSLAEKMDKSANGSDIENVSVFLQNLGLNQLATLSGIENSFPFFDGSNTVRLSNITTVGRTFIAAEKITDIVNYLGIEESLNGKQPLDATLTALAALEGSANKLPYFTAADAIKLTDLTAFARTLLGRSDAASVLSDLGLGPIATAADIQAGTAKKMVDATGLKSFLPKRNFAANDFVRIPDVPGGLIIQWGAVEKSIPEGVQNIIFPTPFPNFSLMAMATPSNLTGNNGIDVFSQVGSISNSDVNFFFSWVSTAVSADGFRWFALGF